MLDSLQEIVRVTVAPSYDAWPRAFAVLSVAARVEGAATYWPRSRRNLKTSKWTETRIFGTSEKGFPGIRVETRILAADFSPMHAQPGATLKRHKLGKPVWRKSLVLALFKSDFRLPVGVT